MALPSRHRLGLSLLPHPGAAPPQPPPDSFLSRHPPLPPPSPSRVPAPRPRSPRRHAPRPPARTVQCDRRRSTAVGSRVSGMSWQSYYHFSRVLSRRTSNVLGLFLLAISMSALRSTSRTPSLSSPPPPHEHHSVPAARTPPRSRHGHSSRCCLAVDPTGKQPSRRSHRA